MKSIDKQIVSRSIITIIISLIIGVFIYNTNIFTQINNIYIFLGILPFLVFYIIALIYCINEILFIYSTEKNKKKLYLNNESQIIEAKVDKVKKHILGGDDRHSTYCYQIICVWNNPTNNKKYKFKSSYFWNNPEKFINTNVNVYIDKNYKNYYIDLAKIEKLDEEQKKIANIEESKYFMPKLYYNFTDTYIDGNFLVGKDEIRKKQIIIPISKINKVIKICNNESIVKIYLYTLGKQIEINLKNNKDFDNLISSLLSKVNATCKIQN